MDVILAKLSSNLLSALGIVATFGIVIFVHEFGHFIVAKKAGVRIHRFAFGFGKEIIGFQWGETRYSLNWIPLGGYVSMAGELVEEAKLTGNEVPESTTPEEKAREFMSKPWYVRVAIAVAGPFMNYVLAIAMFTFVLAVWGQQIPKETTVVGTVIAGMPAEAAGLKVGDKILSVDKQPVTDFLAMRELIMQRADKATALTIERDGVIETLTVTPKQDSRVGGGAIGIAPADPVIERKELSLGGAFKESLSRVWTVTTMTLKYLGNTITSLSEPKELSGPLGIGHVINKAVHAGWESFFALIAFISIGLGLINLFPIPLLDGSHIAYYLYEAVRGKPISVNVIGRINMAGFVFLIGLVVYVTLNDYRRIWGKEAAPEQPVAVEPAK